ncbi:sulfotransferase domain-containing protein [Actinoplanes flavus]|uniref:Sulfotransferase domain-containing protein n=1 Tax=Actinoplanes flavus TaxID=2820290 RepID=A0ABS3V0H7_9ACTN|nr:sulfotransferase domain-containing protein [Actinoplanes flavus]MBO3744342.1 sulfotransferase domain-containing protein [Actinoplanes flavus]
MLNRTVMFAKQHAPESLRVLARRAQLEAHNTRLRLTVPVVDRCEYVNIYHCAVRKTASQWIKSLLSDPIAYRHSGLLTYDPRFYNWSHPRVCPPNRIALSLFFSRKRFDTTPKPDAHRAFFVYRDPRDLVVSSYFSTKDSHGPMGDVLEVRRNLREKSKKDGLLYLVDHLARKGTFNAVRSWVKAPSSAEVALFRYEDLVGPDQAAQVDRLFRHCGIIVPPAEMAMLLDRYSFGRMNDRKGAGKVSHYRKGEAGDWRNHFDDDITEAFNRATGNLLTLLGYDEPATAAETKLRRPATM